MHNAKKPIGFLRVDIFWNKKTTRVIEPYYHPLEIPKAKVRLMGKALEILKRWDQEDPGNGETHQCPKFPQES